MNINQLHLHISLPVRLYYLGLLTQVPTKIKKCPITYIFYYLPNLKGGIKKRRKSMRGSYQNVQYSKFVKITKQTIFVLKSNDLKNNDSVT